MRAHCKIQFLRGFRKKNNMYGDCVKREAWTLWSNGLVIKLLDSQSRRPRSKTAE